MFVCLLTSAIINNWKLGNFQGLFYQKKLKTSTDIIRRVYGDVLLLYYITSVCYYAIAPHVFLADRNPMEKVVVVYFFGSSVVWKLAADFHYKVTFFAFS